MREMVSYARNKTRKMLVNTKGNTRKFIFTVRTKREREMRQERKAVIINKMKSENFGNLIINFAITLKLEIPVQFSAKIGILRKKKILIVVFRFSSDAKRVLNFRKFLNVFIFNGLR